MDMFNILNRQQQPFIQSGYGAMSKLNTLLGLNPRPQASPIMSTPMTAPYMPTPGGGIQPIMQNGPRMYAGGPGGDPYMSGSLPLNRILALRAAHGDTQAASVFSRMQQ